MTTGEAMQIVRQYGAKHRIGGFLETLMAMEESKPFLSSNHQEALEIVLIEMEAFCG